MKKVDFHFRMNCSLKFIQCIPLWLWHSTTILW